jgi:hypothetical protein
MQLTAYALTNSLAKVISMLLFVTQELSLNKNRTHINEGKQHG